MYAFIFRTVFAHMDPERAHHLVIPVIRAFASGRCVRSCGR